MTQRSYINFSCKNGETINITPPLNAGSFSLESIEIPAFYNVQEEIGNSFIINIGTPQNITVHEGFYSASQLVAELEDLLQAVDATFSVSLNSDTLKITISRTGDFSINFDSNFAYYVGFEYDELNTGSASYSGNYPLNNRPYYGISLNISGGSLSNSERTPDGETFTKFISLSNKYYQTDLSNAIYWTNEGYNTGQQIITNYGASRQSISQLTVNCKLLSTKNTLLPVSFKNQKLFIRLSYN